MILRPAGEWTPRDHGWIVARVSEGVGYWFQSGNISEMKVGDGFVAMPNGDAFLRASRLEPLKLQFFTIQPQYLNGVLTVAEWHQLEMIQNSSSPRALIFTADKPIAQKFERLAAQTQNNSLPLRCGLLQLWAGAMAELLTTPSASFPKGNVLRERFRQLVGQMPEIELAKLSLNDLSQQLHCSERHFSRLFREEFGVPLRAHQIESRLQRARQLLADSDNKIINVAYDSGYRHLGLFNAMFKKRFGVTPSEWRRQKSSKSLPVQSCKKSVRVTTWAAVFLAALMLHFALPVSAETNPPPEISKTRDVMRAATSPKMTGTTGEKKTADTDTSSTTNTTDKARAQIKFTVEKYLVMGNTLLSPNTIGRIFTNVPGAFGTNVTFTDIRVVLTDLQAAYRERGYVSVSVGLPQQKLTNATVKVQVTEGRLAAINIVGNRYFTSESIMSALPSLHTNMLLNSRIFQRELDDANLSRDRQIYPVIGPGPDPGTSELTLKVKDQLPFHSRLEINNISTPGTPLLRANFNAQYDNLWNLEHQVGLQYTFTPEGLKDEQNYSATPLDDPLIANYSAYYRLPIGGYSSVQNEVDSNPGSFGYNEVTHQFNLPPATGRPELIFYASRSVSDTGVQLGPKNFLTDETATNSTGVVYHPLSITTNSAGDNITLNQDLGLKFTFQLPSIKNFATTLSFGVDYKRYRQTSYDTNEYDGQTEYVTSQGQVVQNSFAAPEANPPLYNGLDYFPFNAGLSGSVPDRFGTTFFHVTANFNLLPVFSEESTQVTTTTGTNVVTSTKIIHGHSFSGVAYTTNANPYYVDLQLGADREQTISQGWFKGWSIKFHADGQWANEPLISNEQYAMGGTTGVRGYQDGATYGDTGWKTMTDLQTPLIDIGMVGNEGHEVPVWVRGSVFMDYGEVYLIDPPSGSSGRQQFWGVGSGFTANIGNHLDARLTVAFPLTNPDGLSGWSPRHNMCVYFAVGAQF
jgi:hemolysin activation/secretion protein/AraC-like DNA-binding protein